MGWSLKKAVLCLTLALPVAGIKWSLKEALMFGGFVLPATGIPWWRVRFHGGRYFYIHENGWWDELPEWEQESLQEAINWEPEMAVYIHGHSQTCQYHEWPPIWNQDAREWQVSRNRPSSGDFEAQEINLEEFWRTLRGYKETPASSSWEKPAKAPRPSWNDDRFGRRGYASAERRMKKRFLERNNREVPDELKPVKAEMAQEIKKKMKNLWKQCQQVADAVDKAELPDLDKSEESEDSSINSSAGRSSSSCSEPGKADRRGPHRRASLSRGKKGPRLAPVPEADEEDEQPEKAKAGKGDRKESCPPENPEKEKKTRESEKAKEEVAEDEEEEEEEMKGWRKEKRRRRRRSSRRAPPKDRDHRDHRDHKDRKDPGGGGCGPMQVDYS